MLIFRKVFLILAIEYNFFGTLSTWQFGWKLIFLIDFAGLNHKQGHSQAKQNNNNDGIYPFKLFLTMSVRPTVWSLRFLGK